MTTRRQWLQRTAAGAGLLALDARAVFASATTQPGLLTRAIPSTGERLPIVGLGSSATFSQAARSEDVTALREVLERMLALGGTVFDTAPAYGASEEVAGRMAKELGVTQRIFWATKLNVAGFGGGRADPAAARSQLDTSFRRIGKPAIDLVQVHNLGDLRVQLPILREAKDKGRVRYVGVTTTIESQYDELLRTMRNEPIDFIGTNDDTGQSDENTGRIPRSRNERNGYVSWMRSMPRCRMNPSPYSRMKTGCVTGMTPSRWMAYCGDSEPSCGSS